MCVCVCVCVCARVCVCVLVISIKKPVVLKTTPFTGHTLNVRNLGIGNTFLRSSYFIGASTTKSINTVTNYIK